MGCVVNPRLLPFLYPLRCQYSSVELSGDGGSYHSIMVAIINGFYVGTKEKVHYRDYR